MQKQFLYLHIIVVIFFDRLLIAKILPLNVFFSVYFFQLSHQGFYVRQWLIFGTYSENFRNRINKFLPQKFSFNLILNLRCQAENGPPLFNLRLFEVFWRIYLFHVLLGVHRCAERSHRLTRIHFHILSFRFWILRVHILLMFSLFLLNQYLINLVLHLILVQPLCD